VKLKLLRDNPYIGENGRGKFFLYSVNDGTQELAYFADESIHQLIQQSKLKQGSEFQLVKKAVQNGKRMSSQIEFSIVDQAHPTQVASPQDDGLRAILLNCIHDAEYVAKNSGLQFSLDEIQKLATTLFIQRTKLA